MDNISEITLDFFDSRRGNFWKWADDGEILEWHNGITICYKADLLAVLSGTSGTSLPYLGAVVLSMAACMDNWGNNADSPNRKALARRFIHSELRVVGGNINDVEHFDMLLHNAFETLDLIHSLNKDFRSGIMRSHLFRTIFEDLPTAYVAVKNITPILERFQGMYAQEGIRRFKSDGTRRPIIRELEALQACIWRKKGVSALEEYLLTSLTKPPKPAEIEPLPEPNSVPLTLMEALLEDKKTEGLATLAQRLLAAIHIPSQTRGSSDQPFGGFSDITNRGNFDRLLMSELAQDDDTLTARLVNNEALYLRREEPPSDVERERTILVDTTLKMWGFPRVFAMAAALACAEKKQNIGQINAFILRGPDFETLDLTTKKGVIEGLGQLDVALHCGAALTDFLGQTKPSAKHDMIFITDEESFKTVEFQPYFTQKRHILTYLIVVNRLGDLQVFDISGGKNKSLGVSKFDLNDLLFPKISKPKRANSASFKPAFYDEDPLPLYFLPTGAKFSRMHLLKDPSVGVINITHSQRVLRWADPNLGAIELLPFIEEGEYCIGFGSLSMIYILVGNEKTRLFKFYKLDSRKGLVESHDYTGKTFATVDEMAYYKSHFHLKNGKIIDCRTGELTTENIDFKPIFDVFTAEKDAIDFKDIKHFIKNQQNPLQHPKDIFINTAGELMIDTFAIVSKRMDDLSFKKTKKEQPHAVENDLDTTLKVSSRNQNSEILFYEKQWADGSFAAVDSRGFLHLKSSDYQMPEITIVLNFERVAAWASDGKMCGAPYFMSAENPNPMPVNYFYSHYIQPFIDHILSH
jgi:hypothetical protein